MTEPTEAQLAAEETWRAAQADIARHDAEFNQEQKKDAK